jgi:acyl-CoA synthetase (AMP-forming)/AMP-acid ligase II
VKVAILADIHGNTMALENVLEDAESINVEEYWFLGDFAAIAFPDSASVSKERVARYVIRTAKRHAIDADGQPLFKPRQTRLVPVSWEPRHDQQRSLYEAVTEYVRQGYNQALREQKTYIGFLMILMQRLITSSTAAIRTSLERRLAVLDLPQGQLSLFPEDVGEDWSALDGQQQLDTILKTRLKGLKDERKEVELLLSAARRCEASGPDVKAEALLERIQQQQREENDPTLKVLIFTDELPKTRSGKIMRRLLRELVTSNTVAGDVTTLEDMGTITRLAAQHDDD